jgi:hypothetical protein
MRTANLVAGSAALGALLAAIQFASTPVGAQTPPPPRPPTAAAPATPAKPALSSTVTGTWSGPVTEVGRSSPFPVTITIDAKGGTTTYSEQSCSGTLTRIAASGPYVFYAEKITKGAYDKAKGSGCLDGTMVLTRAGNTVLMSWFGVLDNEAYHAAAKLAQVTPKI